MKKCEYCKKTLVPIGTARKSGKATHSDWDTRKYHKKCWITIREIERLIEKYKDEK
jgi:hypothetical protein